ncbi:MAG: helix-turn-helix transcriptional regulator [Terriglobales bacterium]
MKKHSPRDIAFMKVFAEKLRKARDNAKKVDGVSYEEFAHRLGVTRAGIHKYFNEENVPSLDILERAKSLGVEVKYGELDVGLIRARARRDDASAEAQMLLPLAIESLADQNVTIEVGSRKPNAIELNVTIKFEPKRARS